MIGNNSQPTSEQKVEMQRMTKDARGEAVKGQRRPLQKDKNEGLYTFVDCELLPHAALNGSSVNCISGKASKGNGG